MKLTLEKSVTEHQRLVYFVAKRFFKRASWLNIEFEDLVSEGMIGLLKAVKRFNPEFGVKFSTYAVPMIEGQIRRFLRDTNPGPKFPRSIKELAIKTDGMETAEEIMEKLQVTKEVADGVIAYRDHSLTYSMDKQMNDNDGKVITFADMVGHQEDFSGIEVSDFLSRLPKNQKIAIELAMLGKSQQEIGKVIGCSQVHVSRLLKKIQKTYLEYLEESEMATITLDQYKKLKDEGLSDKEVAEKAGITHPTLSYHKKKWFSEAENTIKAQVKPTEGDNSSVDKTVQYEELIHSLKAQVTSKESIVSQLKAKIEKYEHINAACADVEEEVAALREENQALKKQVEELENAPLPVLTPLQCDCEVKVRRLEEENAAMRQLLKLWM